MNNNKIALLKTSFLIGVVLLLQACSTISKELVTEKGNNALTQELMDPLYSGQQELINQLGTTDYEPIIFKIKNNAIVRVAKTKITADLWSPEHIVFFKVKESSNDNLRSLYYFDKIKSHFYRLDSSKKKPFIIFKSMPYASKWYSKESKLKLVRLRFNFNKSGSISFSDTKKVNGLSGNPYSPVYLHEKSEVFFLSKKKNKHLKLISMDSKGKNLKEYKQDTLGNVSHIFSNNNSDLIVQSDKKGYQSLFRLNPDTGSLSDYVRRNNKNLAGGNQYILANRYSKGYSTPIVMKTPNALDLDNITSLVIAQNPQVSVKRAQYAATLVQIGVATLHNSPAFTFQLGTSSLSGLFQNQRGFLSRTLTSGLVGLVQPVLDFKRNKELHQAEKYTAKIAKNQIDNEINEKVAEALKLYFQLLYLQEMNSIWDSLMFEYNERISHYSKLRAVGNATARQILSANKTKVAGVSEQKSNQRQISFLMRRLKQLCGLSPSTDITLDQLKFKMSEAQIGNEKTLHDIAILNHPKMNTALNSLKRAYYLEEAGPDIRKKLNFTAEYEYLGNSISNSLTDELNFNLSGSVSMADNKAGRLHKEYWKHIKDSLQIKVGIRSDEIHLSLEEAFKDFKAAKNDYLAKQADTAYLLEKVRVARLYQNIDTSVLESRKDPLAVSTATQDYLHSLSRLAKVKKDLGIRFVNIWRETGRSKLLPKELKMLLDKPVLNKKASLWLWETKDVIANALSRQIFIRTAKQQNINRVYAYLYSDSRLLANQLEKEQFTQFINACQKEGIEVWALLGEPEWLLDVSGNKSIATAINRITIFNKLHSSNVPKISGVKIDLEPFSITGWESDNQIRDRLTHNYLQLLKVAKTTLHNEIPLWVDSPVKLFLKKKNAALLNKITQITDGVTAMVYFHKKNTIIKVAKKLLRVAHGPIEIGIEFSEKAPASDTLFLIGQKNMSNTVNIISEKLKNNSNYKGISLHDYSALKHLLNGSYK